MNSVPPSPRGCPSRHGQTGHLPGQIVDTEVHSPDSSFPFLPKSACCATTRRDNFPHAWNDTRLAACDMETHNLERSPWSFRFLRISCYLHIPFHWDMLIHRSAAPRATYGTVRSLQFRSLAPPLPIGSSRRRVSVRIQNRRPPLLLRFHSNSVDSWKHRPSRAASCGSVILLPSPARTHAIANLEVSLPQLNPPPFQKLFSPPSLWDRVIINPQCGSSFFFASRVPLDLGFPPLRHRRADVFSPLGGSLH